MRSVTLALAVCTAAPAFASLVGAMIFLCISVLLTNYLFGAGRRWIVLLLVGGSGLAVGLVAAAHGQPLATARADLVIVSTHAGRDLPHRVKAWMKACLTDRRIPDGALVALIRVARDLKKGQTPVHTFLCSMAQQSKMDYMPEFIYL